MTDPLRITVGKAIAFVAVLSAALGIALYVGFGLSAEMYGEWALHNALGGASLGAVFYLMVQKQPRNGAVWAIGWSALLQGLPQVLASAIANVLAADRYGREVIGALATVDDLPMPIHFSAWLQQWSWIPALGLLLTFALLLFPDGRLPGRRWKAVGWLSAIAIGAATLGFASETEIVTDDAAMPGLAAVGLPLLGLAILLSVSSIIVRYRRSVGDARHQLRWFGFGTSVMGVTGVIVFALSAEAFKATSLIALPLLVGSLAIAVLKYRLYDIDVVISRSLTYAALAAFIGVVYIGIVVGVGTLFGQGDKANFGLSILATGLVAMAFQPLRRWVQRAANRLVFGERATPYEVLAQFSRRAAEASDEHLLARIPKLIVDGTGASQAALWVQSGSGFRVASAWPEEEAPRRVSGADEFTDPSADYSVPVYHQGELLGAISLVTERREAITPSEVELVENLASGMGLALRNARLTARLRRQVEELERSRDRVVTAADRARRSLEHDLDSGPQQQLVALKVKLGPARKMAERAGAVKSATVLAQLEEAAGDAIRAVRDFAGGVYPPLLEADGLAVAIGHQGRKAALPITVTADGVGRYPREVEAAVYFTVLEALQNATKYASASGVTVSLGDDGESLTFEVTDDGTGFDAASVARGAGLSNMADRLDSVGGSLSIESEPGVGTTVRGEVPVAERLVPA